MGSEVCFLNIDMKCSLEICRVTVLNTEDNRAGEAGVGNQYVKPAKLPCYAVSQVSYTICQSDIAIHLQRADEGVDILYVALYIFQLIRRPRG